MRVHSFQIVGRLKSIKVDDFWVDFPKIWGESTLIDPPPPLVIMLTKASKMMRATFYPIQAS